MPGTKILSAILMVPATVLLTAQASLSEPAAEQCKHSPGASAPRGSHWYYRINHATNQHCWYLGPVGSHAKAHMTTTASESVPVMRKADAADADGAAPQAAMSEAAAPALDAAQAAPAPAAAAPAAVAQPAPADQAAAANEADASRFLTRWPENLPKVEDLDQSEPGSVSNSYAERRDADAAALPSKWPVAEANRAAASSAGETALRYFSLAGIFAIPLVLIAGIMAKYAREPHGSDFRYRLRMMVNRLRPRRRLAFDEAVFAEPDAPPLVRPAAPRRRAAPDWQARTPTDPAHDLKTSLAELMRDLRSAAEPEEPVRYAERSRDRVGERAFEPFLEAAE
jgi:hypothetical protein